MAYFSPLEAVDKFYNEVVVVKYPGISKEQCKEICRAPFTFLKKWILSDKFPTIRFKYFGIFVPNERLLRYTRKLTEQEVNLGKIPKEYLEGFDKRTKDFFDYLNAKDAKENNNQ